jgi:hypothetical protein
MSPEGDPQSIWSLQVDSCWIWICAILWSNINKNVDYINYIYYNQQRFINYTQDTPQGVASQLDAISRMAWEGKRVLGIILA